MANFCLMLQYDGSRYNGWQRQGNTSNTIQEKLERLLESLYGEPIELHGSGRTDAGVHALGQIANFKIPRMLSRYSRREILEYLNASLPADIRVLGVEKADDRFHARLSAVGKLYEYRIDCGEISNIFQRRYLTRVREPLNIEKMRQAAAFLTGTHDFKSFCDNRRMKKSTVRYLRAVQIRREGPEVQLRFTGNGFLQNMVRILVGTLVEVGRGERAAEDLPGLFQIRRSQDEVQFKPDNEKGVGTFQKRQNHIC